MTDMLVKLYDNKERSKSELSQELTIQRALAIDATAILAFVKEHFVDISAGWIDECAACLYRQPSTCFVAYANQTVVGFACYDATAKGMVGPIGVAANFRKKGIASALLTHCFEAMKADGYAYAVIGWVSSIEFYQKTCDAIEIPDSFPGIYRRMREQN